MSDWINWNGGICPVPVHTGVMVKLRFGGTSDAPMAAGFYRWDHGRTPDSPLRGNDIVAYRLEDRA